MPVIAKSRADFKGTLLQARQKPGQWYAVLLFQTDQGLRFCLSKNARLVRSMDIGSTYRIKGLEYTSGDKTYLDIASSTLVRSKIRILRKRAGLLASAASVLLIIGLGGTGFVQHRGAQRNNQTDAPSVNLESEHDENTPGKSNKIKKIINQPPTGTPPKGAAGDVVSPPTSTPVRPTPTPEPQAVAPVPQPAPAPAPEPTPEPTPTPAPTPEPTPEPTPSPTPPPTPTPATQSLAPESAPAKPAAG